MRARSRAVDEYLRLYLRSYTYERRKSNGGGGANRVPARRHRRCFYVVRTYNFVNKDVDIHPLRGSVLARTYREKYATGIFRSILSAPFRHRNVTTDLRVITVFRVFYLSDTRLLTALVFYNSLYLPWNDSKKNEMKKEK